MICKEMPKPNPGAAIKNPPTPRNPHPVTLAGAGTGCKKPPTAFGFQASTPSSRRIPAAACVLLRIVGNCLASSVSASGYSGPGLRHVSSSTPHPGDFRRLLFKRIAPPARHSAFDTALLLVYDHRPSPSSVSAGQRPSVDPATLPFPPAQGARSGLVLFLELMERSRQGLAA